MEWQRLISLSQYNLFLTNLFSSTETNGGCAGTKRAKVARPRACTLCRECIRDGEEWERRISLRRVKDHFICKSLQFGA